MKSLLTRDEKPEGIGYAQCNTPIFSHDILENFMGNEKVQGNVYMKLKNQLKIGLFSLHTV